MNPVVINGTTFTAQAPTKRMSTESKTPRTDAAWAAYRNGASDLLSVEEMHRQIETELAEAQDRATAAEFRLSCTVNANTDHEADYLAVWKLIKRPNETVVQAAQRVVMELVEARRELSTVASIVTDRECGKPMDVVHAVELYAADKLRIERELTAIKHHMESCRVIAGEK